MDERAVIGQCLEGDTESFRQIVVGHRSALMAAAVTVLGNRQDAEDACQDTFIQAYQHLASFDSGRDLRAWLYTILYRRCLNAIKRKKTFGVIVDRMRHEPERWAQPQDIAPVETAGLPAALLAVLSPKERTVLSLWVNEDYTAVEIAAVLGCPAGTARYYLFNVRKKIRALSEKTHENLSKR